MTTGKSVQILLFEGGRPARILLERPLPADGRVGVALKEGDGVADLVSDKGYDIVQLDLQLPGNDASGGLKMVRGSGPGAEVVVVYDGESPTPELPLPVGDSYRFLTRPVDPSEIRALLGRDDGPSRPPPRRLSAVAAGIVGSSPALSSLLEKVERVAAAPASVLIQGETGTGKSLVARALHEASDRRERPFVIVNCSAFQDQLLESELFGHEKGAFTGAVAAKPGLFEVADRGTLFLDEVAEMSPAMQAKLLQVLDTRELRRVGGTRMRKVEVRIVSASNKGLQEEVRAGRFREDLMFRLNVVTLTVPPLRERKTDIPELVAHFLARFRPAQGEAKKISPEALKMLTEHRWPGNVRELANTIEGLVLLAPGATISAQDLPPAIRPATDFELGEADAPLPMAEIERLHVARALRYTGGKKAPAARLLGIDVKTLNNKIRSYSIELESVL